MELEGAFGDLSTLIPFVAAHIWNVLKLLAQTGARPERIRLDLTDRLLLERTERVVGTMYLHKARGSAVHLMTSATRYSLLVYLKRFPLDQLKIA